MLNIKKHKIIPFIILINIVFILALVSSCQYEDIEFYQEDEEYYYHNGDFIGINLNMDELVKLEIIGDGTLGGRYLKVTNNLDVPINLSITYKKLSPPAFGVNSVQTYEGFSIEANDDNQFYDAYLSEIQKYKYVEPNIITHETKSITKNRTICKICSNGKECIGDGDPCSLDIECGSGICNIAGLCGDKEIVDCPNGFLNCKDKSCLEPSKKEVGEGYECSFECKSDRFEDGACLISSRGIIIFVVIILLCLGIALYFIFRTFYKKSWKEKEGKIIKEAEEKAKKIIKDSQNNLEEINRELIDKNFQKEELREELSHLQNEKKKSNKIKKDISKINKEIEELTKEQINKRDELEKIRKGLKKRNEKYWKEKALEDSHQRDKLYFNEKDYLAYKSNGKLYHVWLYEDYLKKRGESIPYGVPIHHIDGNKYNNALWNLMPMDKNIHNIITGENLKGKFNHNLIETYNWKSGIEQIKKQLGIKNKDFPEHIQNRIKDMSKY